MEYKDVIKAPIITEKSNDLQANNTYVFSVDVKANKVQKYDTNGFPSTPMLGNTTPSLKKQT